MWPNPSLNPLYQREQIEAVEGVLPDVRGMKILDVGCGTGRMSRYFASRGADVTAFDFSDKAVDIAKAAPAPPPEAPDIQVAQPKYSVNSVFDIDYRQEFDVAFTWGVLTIACRERQLLQQALGRVRDAVRPGGKLLFLEPVHRGMLHRVLSLSLSDFVADLGAVGCDVTLVRGLHFWPARVVLAYAAWPRWMTDPMYHLGQRFLRSPAWGDYKLILATRKA